MLLAACGGPGLLPQACGLTTPVSLPVEMHGRAPTVNVVINQQKVNLLVDTGANVTVLNRNTAARLNVVGLAGSMVGQRAVGGTSTAVRARIDQMQMGPLTLPAMRVAISNETPFDGVLGLDVLQRYDVEIELLRGRIILHPGRLCPGDLPPLEGSYVEIPAARTIISGHGANRVTEPYLLVPVRLDGKEALAMLDSGSMAGTLVSPGLAASVGVTELALAQDVSARVISFGTGVPMRGHRFSELDVGREVFKKPMMLVGGDPNGLFAMVIGSDYFFQHRIWFSFSSDRIFVVPLAR
jgi:hypothetical protein